MFTVPQQSCGILVTDKGTPSMPYDARSDEGRLRLKRQLGETEGEVVAREGREVEIHAEHVIRPVQGKSVGQGDAELRAGGRQIGARDLDLSRRLDRPAEERLRLPVGARDGPYRRQAPVARGRAAFGFRARADLRAVACNQVTALGASEIKQGAHGVRALRPRRQREHRVRERRDVRQEPRAPLVVESGGLEAEIPEEPRKQIVAGMLGRQLRRRRSEVVALHQVGVRVGRAECLGFGLDSFHAYERARLVQDRDDPGEHAPRERLDRHAARHFPVDLDDVRLQPPDAVEVRIPRAKIVDHDEAAELAVVLDRRTQAFLVLERRLDQLHRHPVRRKTVRLQHVQEERSVPQTFGGDLRIDVEKQPAARVAEPLEVPDMEGPALAVETYPLLALRRLAEQLQRLDVSSAREMDRANQAFVTDGTAMSENVDRLEMARQTELVSLAPFPLRVVLVEKKRRSKIHHVHRAPAILRNSRYRQKYAEYAI